MTAWRSRLSRWPKIRWTSPMPMAGLSGGWRRTMAWPSPGCTGCWWRRPGLSIVSADAAVRRRTVDVMHRLVELCALMGGRYLVHGSPKQRSVPAGIQPRRSAGARHRMLCAGGGDGRQLRCDLLRRAAVHARDRPDQHRGRGGGHRRRHRLAGPEDHDRLQRGRPDRGRDGRSPDGALDCGRATSPMCR